MVEFINITAVKPALEIIEPDAFIPFRYKCISTTQFDAPWHFHPEIELTYIIKSSGRRYVGDSIEDFNDGDLIMIGSNMPHYWLNSTETNSAQCIVIQFLPGYMGSSFFSIPAFGSIKKLFINSALGLKYSTETSLEIGSRMQNIQNMSPARKTIELLEILQHLSEITDYVKLSGEGFMTDSIIQGPDSRMNSVQKYVMENFKNKVKLEEAASSANLELSAFCRWFKSSTRKTFIEYVNELRISYSSRLLLETNLSVTEICYESGFINISNFNHFFKRIKGINPLQFRKLHRIE